METPDEKEHGQKHQGAGNGIAKNLIRPEVDIASTRFLVGFFFGWPLEMKEGNSPETSDKRDPGSHPNLRRNELPVSDDEPVEQTHKKQRDIPENHGGAPCLRWCLGDAVFAEQVNMDPYQPHHRGWKYSGVKGKEARQGVVPVLGTAHNQALEHVSDKRHVCRNICRHFRRPESLLIPG